MPLLLGLEQGRIVPGRMAASALDFVLLAAGLALYLRGTRARDRVGGWGLWAMDALAGGGLRR